LKGKVERQGGKDFKKVPKGRNRSEKTEVLTGLGGRHKMEKERG